MIYTTEINTPLGKMMIGATEQGICLFDFEHRKSIELIIKRIETGLEDKLENGGHRLFDVLEEQVAEYFSGARKAFDLPLHMVGTDFQKKVWSGLLHIPYGETRTYKEQSVFLGDVKAIRAVASANGDNGIEIIVPCHRVIGGDGSLTGYGGGLPKKKWLLAHEAKYSGKSTQTSLDF